MGSSIDEEYIRYLLGTPDAGLSPIGSDELKDQGSWMTQLSKFGNANTDLDTLIAMGILPPNAYDPMSVTEPVDAPGYRQVQEWRNGSPFERYVATAIEFKSPSEIIREIQSLANGDVPEGFSPEDAQSIVGTIPLRVDYHTGEMTDLPDLQYVQDQVLNLDKLRSSDPDYTLDANGMPVFTTQEESPAMKAAIEAGYTTTPGQPFDPYDIAPMGQYEADLAQKSAAEEAYSQYLAQQKMVENATNLNKVTRAEYEGGYDPQPLAPMTPEQEKALRDRQSSAEGSGLRSGRGRANTARQQLRGGSPSSAPAVPGPPEPSRSRLAPRPMEVGEEVRLSPRDLRAQTKGPRTSSGKRSRPEPPKPPASAGAWQQNREREAAVRADTRRGQAAADSRKKLNESQGAEKKARSAWQDDYYANLARQKEHEMRQAMVQELARRQITPFDMERRSRNQLTSGY
ncbi:MAG TPA: hypothetical protein VMW08_08950 [Acidimicrobiales bacterium]|nr:hypothetical protein [Acidimicrobiales bacterium]